MNAQVSTLLLILAALIGLFIGLLLSSLFSAKEGRPKAQPPREIQKEGYGEVARLWYSPAGKKILTELDGGFYKGFDALSADQQSKVKKILSLWQDWAGTAPLAETPAQAIPMLDQRYQPVTVQSQEEEYYDPAAFTPAAPAIAPFASVEEDTDVISSLQQSLEPEEDAAASFMPSQAADLSITQQINAILQDILSTTDLADKGIKLEENLEHGVDVLVGAEKFSGIEDVPYPQVRTLIHEAVLRWEQETESQQRLGE